MKSLPIFFAIVVSVASQGPPFLESFQGIKEVLLRGTELQINVDANRCRTTNLENNNVLASIPLRQWQHITLRTGAEEIRSDDFYVDTSDPTVATFIARAVNIYDDDSVKVTLTFTLVGSDNAEVITFDCDLGVGAEVHEVISGFDLVNIESYSSLKSLLLLGDHVEAVGYLNECSNADEVFTDGNQYVVGYQINRFEIFGDATPGEVLVFDDVAVYSATGNAGDMVLSTEQVIIARDGSAVVTIAVFSFDLEEVVRLSLQCQIGSALRLTVHERENENTYSTYSAIREATLNGHDMEIVVFTEYCTVLEGPSISAEGTIVSARTDAFQLFKANSIWGEQEYIAWSSWTLGVDRNFYVDIARLYEDESMTIEYITEDRDFGEVVAGKLNCPLREGTVFHAVRRTRRPLVDYEEILNEIIRRGQTYEIEIDFDQCLNPSGLPLNSIFGGIAWQTYIDATPEQGFFYADIFSLVEQNFTDPRGPAWDAAGITLRPDNSVSIDIRLYEWQTGINLVPEAAESIQCTLGSGVSLFRYP